MKMTNNKLHVGKRFLIKQWPPSFRFADSTQDPEELEYAILRTSDARQVDGLSLPSGVRIRAAVQAKRGLAGGREYRYALTDASEGEVAGFE
jgi:hypothetical protein